MQEKSINKEAIKAEYLPDPKVLEEKVKEILEND